MSFAIRFFLVSELLQLFIFGCQRLKGGLQLFMEILMFIVFGIGGGIFWLRQIQRNAASRAASTHLAMHATSGRINLAQLSGTFDTLIKKIAYNNELQTAKLNKDYILQNSTAAFKAKYTIKSVTGAGNDYLLTGDARVKDLRPTSSGNKEMDKYYAASLLIKINTEEKTMAFYSPFPHEREQEYVLKDLADFIYSLVSNPYNTFL